MLGCGKRLVGNGPDPLQDAGVMSRILIAVASALLILGGITVWLIGRAESETPAIEAAADEWAADAEADPLALPVGTTPQGGSRLPTVPGATTQTKEQRRFARYDRDRDGIIGRDEMLSSRVKAFRTLDRNGDRFLSFEEWSIATAKRFDGADKDRSKTLSAAEFAATAPKPAAKARCRC